MNPQFDWQFGGCLRGFPPHQAWAIVAVCAVVGLAAVVWLYRRTLRPLSPGARITLVGFRAAIVLLLLLCLANPARLENDRPPVPGRKTLAVIVDRSASMSLPDARRSTRLAAALRVWNQHESEAAKAFSQIKFYRFATGLITAANLNEAVDAAEPGPETRLYSALRQALDANPDTIVCLTDGLDTTGNSRDELTGEALRRNVPLYFVAGINQLQPARAGEVMDIHEIKVPAKVLRQTQFAASALFKVTSPQNSELPVELWSGETRLASASLSVRPGQNILPWTVTVTAGEAGTMPLEFRAGKDFPLAAGCTVAVADHKTVDVLYYQGALQWGYRFLRLALAGDADFRLTSILNPALNVQVSSGTTGAPTWPDLPETADQLKRFQVVILAHVFVNQLTARQQAALVEYVNGGGAVVFIAPDDQAAGGFAGSALEQMLPVVFASAPADDQNPDAGVLSVQIAGPQAAQSQSLPDLKPFALPAGTSHSAVSAVFDQSGDGLPQYVQNVAVRAVKPGAEILAVSRPTDGSEPQVLLARQQFGNGFAVAMMTDLLWRWKLSLPSDSRALERFWQQLLLSLAPVSGEGLRLTKLTESPTTNAPVALQVTGSLAGAPPKVVLVSPGKETRPLTLQPAPGEENGWTASFIPTVGGTWQVAATGTGNTSARLVFPVAENPASAEMRNQPPDVDGLRQLAEATGGGLIEAAPVFQPLDATVVSGLVHVRPLWNSSALLGMLLGLYGLELIVRRRFKLL